MQVPIADIFDRFIIISLKRERLENSESFERQYLEFKQALEEAIKPLNAEQRTVADKYLDQLLIINKAIWDLECDIRAGKENELGLEEIGSRALLIRNHNGSRALIKNAICVLFDQDQYKDVKVDHIAEDLFKKD